MTTEKQGIAIYDKNDFNPKTNYIAKQHANGITPPSKTQPIAEYSKEEYDKSLMTKHFCGYSS